MLGDSTARPEDPASIGAPQADQAFRGIIIGPCPPDDRAEALAVLYRRLSTTTRARTIVEVLRQEAHGAIDLSGLWVARRGGRVVGAMLTQALAGRAAALWPPVVARCWGVGGLGPEMVRRALRSYRGRGARLAQALVDRDAPRRAGSDLALGGLPYVTDLISLGRPTAEPLPPVPGRPRLAWEPFDPARAADFARALERSYLESLDMPELAGLRGLDDVMQGHRARGPFDPGRWQLGRLEPQGPPVAVLLLSAGEGRTWEVSYLGLAPEARGRGLGRAILARALELAGPHADRIELAVDARNRPAERLYRRCGFRPFDRRGVHLASLDGPRPDPAPRGERAGAGRPGDRIADQEAPPADGRG